MKRKTLVAVCMLVLSMAILTGCGGAPVETVPETTAAVAVPVVTEAPETAEGVVREFAEAYFYGDEDALWQRLSAGYTGEPEIYREGDGAAVVIHAVKGIENAAETERCTASVEFKKTADSDYYLYLTVELTKEQGQWKVLSYGLEM